MSAILLLFSIFSATDNLLGLGCYPVEDGGAPLQVICKHRPEDALTKSNASTFVLSVDEGGEQETRLYNMPEKISKGIHKYSLDLSSF